MNDNPWSGLAPAVDAHLARWAEAEKARPKASALVQHACEETVVAALRTPLIGEWITFAASYGIPDKDGVPQAAAITMDGITSEGATITGREQFNADEVCIEQGAVMALRELVMLHQGTTHYVTAEVVTEVTEAASLMAPEPLHPTDLFCPVGIAFLEEPLLVPDFDPDTGEMSDDLFVHVRAIGWHKHGGIVHPGDGLTRDGVSLFLYSTGLDAVNGYLADLEASGRELDGHDMTARKADLLRDPHRLLPIEVVPWSFGIDWTTRERPEHVPGTVPTSVGYERRWFLAFMRLMWQQIVVARPHFPPRAQQRRWERLAQRKPLLDYTVLRLRRVVDPTADHLTGTGIPLDHRVLVRGHWRNVHVKSLGAARLPDGSMDPVTHRLVWIEPHWRGPEDGPIGAMEHATVVSR